MPKTRRKTPVRPARKRRITWFVVIVVPILVIALLFALSPKKVVPEASLTSWNAMWPPMPVSRNPAHAENILRDAYAFAANREDIVRSIPCYCGCERKERHQSLRDCFIRGRAPDGTPQWDRMGYT